MVEKISLAAAVTALQENFGSRLEATREEGHRLMVDALQSQFNISRHEADNLVRDLEQARTIRYRPGTAPTGIPGSTPTARGGAEQVLVPMDLGSYWQLGSAD